MAQQTNVAKFFEQWEIYQSVIVNNYMFHSEIVDIVTNEIDRFESLSILDLGCGDAYVVGKSITGDKKVDYHGVDISNASLQFARENLQGINGAATLINNDFVAELENIHRAFDIIISGYTLHHLEAEDKKRFFSSVAGVLAERGVFIFYDIEKEPKETPADFNERCCNIVANRWVSLGKKGTENTTTHMKESDKPETEAFHREGMKKAGLSAIRKVFRDKDDRYSVYIAERN
ncbi:MAG: class I SAM-dependent methyltransferase [Gammaproteobacteria bacterium]|nr:class I SAM-dependent methyltransferase [Gammaproteobacteria bacterium]